MLFNIFINSALIKVQGESNTPQILAYADDIVLLSRNSEHLKELFLILKEELTKLGMKISMPKSGILAPSSSDISEIEGISRKREYTYLGMKINQHSFLDSQKEIVQKTINRSNKIKFILKNPHLPFKNKRMFYIMLARPVCEYASLCFRFNPKQMKDLQVNQNRISSWILGVSEHSITPIKLINANILPIHARFEILAENRYFSWKTRKNICPGFKNSQCLRESLDQEITSQIDVDFVEEKILEYSNLPDERKTPHFIQDNFIPGLSFTRWRSNKEMFHAQRLWKEELESQKYTSKSSAIRAFDFGIQWKAKNFSYINKFRINEFIRKDCPLCDFKGNLHLSHILQCPSTRAKRILIELKKIIPITVELLKKMSFGNIFYVSSECLDFINSENDSETNCYLILSNINTALHLLFLLTIK